MLNEFLVSYPMNFETYKKGVDLDRGKAIRQKDGFCGCDYCVEFKNLIKAYNEEVNGPSFAAIPQKNPAVFRKVKMSVEIEKEGFLNLPNISKRTDGRFSSVYFSKPGKYSLVSIYKQARDFAKEHGDKLSLIDEEVSASLGEGKLLNQYKKSFAKTIVIGKLEGDFWDSIKNSIQNIIAGVKVEEVEEVEEAETFKDVFLLNDRFIPLMYDKTTLYRFTDEDGSFEKDKPLPVIPSNGGKSVNYIVNVAKKMQKAYSFANYRTVSVFAYDTKEHQFVTNVEIKDQIWHLVNKNIEEHIDYVKKRFQQKMSPKEFMNLCRRDFKFNGAGDFEVTEILPFFAHSSWNVNRPGKDEKQQIKQSAYLAAVSYNGKSSIGNDGRHGGYVVLRYSEEDKRPRLAYSAWCQRVSSWSKNQYGFVDQKYDLWPIADWLSGPFAEREGLKLKAAPLLFAGNKFKDRKKNALANLRKRLKIG